MFVPDPHRHPARIAELRALGVRFHDSYQDLLGDGLDAVWLPVPIHLHRSMTEAALERGVRVMCEKPVAATIDDVLAMRNASHRTGIPVLVGFQNIYEPATLELKHTLLDARRGRPLHAVVSGGWPRGRNYYQRNNWAGRLRHRDAWVFDGPASNAMAHFINLAAFLLGTTPDSSAVPTRIEVELYRANNIESYDTFSARVNFDDGSSMTVLLTHACSREIEPTVSIFGDGIQAVWRDMHDRILVDIHGEARSIPRTVDGRDAMIQKLIAADSPGPAATLETSLAHTMIINGALEASRIHNIPKSAWRQQLLPEHGFVTAIDGIEAAIDSVASRRKLLGEMGCFAWAQPSDSLDLRGYQRFNGLKQSSSRTTPTIVVKANRANLPTTSR